MANLVLGTLNLGTAHSVSRGLPALSWPSHGVNSRSPHLCYQKKTGRKDTSHAGLKLLTGNADSCGGKGGGRWAAPTAHLPSLPLSLLVSRDFLKLAFCVSISLSPLHWFPHSPESMGPRLSITEKELCLGFCFVPHHVLFFVWRTASTLGLPCVKWSNRHLTSLLPHL